MPGRSFAIAVPEREIEFVPIRAQGKGGQNVNKVSSAVHLRFDIGASSLPEIYKERLLRLPDQRISGEGVIVIKAQRHRTLEKNREDALARLYSLIERAAAVPLPRKPTRPTRASRKRRLENKARRAELKKLRAKVRSGND